MGGGHFVMDPLTRHRHRYLQSRRGSSPRHSSSISLPNMSLLSLFRGFLFICVALLNNDGVTSSPILSATQIHTSRAAFCSHNTRQTSPSLRNGKLAGEYNRSSQHPTLTIHYGTISFRRSCPRTIRPMLRRVLSLYESSSALGSTERKSIDETLNLSILNGDVPNENSAQQSREQHGIISVNLDPTTATNTVVQREDGAFLSRVAVLFSLVVLALLKMSPSGAWRFYLAGGICASTSHAITTPIDVVKTRQQVDPTLQEKSMWKATAAIVKQGGPFALLAGLGPTALGYLLEGGVKFGIYEVSKPVTKRFFFSTAKFLSIPGLNSQVNSLFLCGLISGTAASLMLSPMEALRIRMVSDSEYAGKSSIDAFSLMVRREGVSSISKGLPAMLLKQVPYTITKNCSFDIFTMWAYRIWREMGHALTANVKIAVPLLSAVAAAVLSCISSHPGDMLLSLVNAHEGPKRTRDFAKEIMQGQHGMRGFFIGIKPRFLHVILIVTVQLMIYDFVKRLVGIAATGLG